MNADRRGDTPKVPGAVPFGWAPDMRTALRAFAGLSADESARVAGAALADSRGELQLEVDGDRYFAGRHAVLLREVIDRGVYVYRVLDEVRR